MADIHQHALLTRTAFLLNSADYSDLIITCKDHEFKVHRNIVLPASKVLATACSGKYKVGSHLMAQISLLVESEEADQHTGRHRGPDRSIQRRPECCEAHAPVPIHRELR